MKNSTNDSDLLLEPNKLESFITNNAEIIIVHVSNNNSYEKAHIPQAIAIPAWEICSDNKNIPGKLPKIKNLEILFGGLGYNKDKHFIVYDDEGGGWAGRFIWLLDSIGHSKYSYLNGGLIAWMREKYPIENQGSGKINPTSVKITLNNKPTADMQYIRANLDRQDILLWDARSEAEYHGQVRFAKKGGHIPNAINLEWLKCLDPEHNYRIKEDISTELAKYGITPEKEIITYCQNHHRSGLAYMIAKLNGYLRVKAYSGSWAEWGNSELEIAT